MFLLGPSLLLDDMVVFFFSRTVCLGQATSWAGGAPQPTEVPLGDAT